MMEIAIAVMNPAITAFDMKFAIQPARARPATRNTAPVASASAAVYVTALVGFPAARWLTTLEDIAATEPAAPNTSKRDPPNRAYPTSASGAAYRPIWAGTPATDAYPIDSGTSSATTLTAAIRSTAVNFPQSYRRSHTAPGNHCCSELGAFGFDVVLPFVGCCGLASVLICARSTPPVRCCRWIRSP